MGRCISIYECDYLLNILSSNSLTQQSITFLKQSQCDSGQLTTKTTPHVCCARNDDSLIFGTGGNDGIQEKSFVAQSAVNTEVSNEKDDSIIYKSSNTLLPKTNECGREKIENRIYSGQVSAGSAVCCWHDKLLIFSFESLAWKWKLTNSSFRFLLCLDFRTRARKNFLGWRYSNIAEVS